jgi:hypothetical protein
MHKNVARHFWHAQNALHFGTPKSLRDFEGPKNPLLGGFL